VQANLNTLSNIKRTISPSFLFYHFKLYWLFS